MQESGAKLPIIESLILASPEPLAARKIADVIENVTPSEVDSIVEELNIKYRDNDISFRIRAIAGGYQMYIIEDYARYVEDFLTRRRSIRMTRAALETLAIIAYRQPVTKTDIEMIRGVASDSVIHTLLERRLTTLAGRADSVGRPLLYKTTDEFLKFFNLNSLNDLPRMEEIEELLAASEPSPQQSLPLNEEDSEAVSSVDETTKQSTNRQPQQTVPLGPFARPVASMKVNPFFAVNAEKDQDQTEEEPYHIEETENEYEPGSEQFETQQEVETAEEQSG